MIVFLLFSVDGYDAHPYTPLVGDKGGGGYPVPVGEGVLGRRMGGGGGLGVLLGGRGGWAYCGVIGRGGGGGRGDGWGTSNDGGVVCRRGDCGI